jgi:tetratricopeptide (TPR) repeat protein
MPTEYDIFISYSRSDAKNVQPIVDALQNLGLRVWFDQTEIADFASVTRSLEDGLSHSKALLAYYSANYPLRWACQWELTSAFIAAQVEGDPRERVLVINPEPSANHIHPVELRDAKFIRAPSQEDPLALRNLAANIREYVHFLPSPLTSIHPIRSPRWFGRNVGIATRFVGRLSEMWRIHSLLHAGQVIVISGITADVAHVSGLGGIGKSLLAEEYARRFGAAFPGGVFWLRAYGNDDAKSAMGPRERESEREQQIRRFAQELNLEIHKKTTPEIEGMLASEIERRGLSCLWVIDDVPSGLNGEDLRHWFAPHPLAKTLITTRSREYGSLTLGLDLGLLNEMEAYELITNHCVPRGELEQTSARALVQDLGCHPLAVDVTGAALAASAGLKSFTEFRDELMQNNHDVLELAAVLSDQLPNGHQTSIAGTLLNSIRQLGNEGRDFLLLASILSTAPIHPNLVAAVFKEVDHLSPSTAKARAAIALRDTEILCLSERPEQRDGLRTVHTLVSRSIRFGNTSPIGHLKWLRIPTALRHWNTLRRTKSLRLAAMKVLYEELSQLVGTSVLQIEPQIAHARELAKDGRTRKEACLLSYVAKYELDRGSYQMAESLYRRLLEISRSYFWFKKYHVVLSLCNLGAVLTKQERLFEARQFHEEAVNYYSQHSTARMALRAKLHLARTLKDLGDLAGARRLQEEVLRINERFLGAGHPDTVESKGMVVKTIVAQGYIADALQMQKETVEVCSRTHGKKHQITLQVMQELTEMLMANNDLVNALTVQGEVVELNQNIHGINHPKSLEAMSTLAQVMKMQGDLEGAEKLLEEVVDIGGRVLGQTHPTMSGFMNELVRILILRGNISKATALREEMLSARTQVFGEGHYDTLASLNNIAHMAMLHGDYARARDLYEQVVKGTRQFLGSEHPMTLVAMNNLGAALRDEGNLAESRSLLESALSEARRILGDQHSVITALVANFTATLEKLEDEEAAERLIEEMIEARTKALDRVHPDVLRLIEELADKRAAREQWSSAHDLYQEIFKIRLRTLGTEHPDTFASAGLLMMAIAESQGEEKALVFLRENLSCLVNHNDVGLTDEQREVRNMFAQLARDNHII